jgi:hypothetical protein
VILQSPSHWRYPYDLDRLEEEWASRDIETPAGCLRWLPYPLADWHKLMQKVIETGPRGCTYLELGAGIGTKVLAARRLGIDGYGIEINPVYVDEAMRIGAQVALGDVRKASVSGHGVVYLNHPLADETAERELEQRVQAELSPGAILVQVRSALVPAGSHWELLGRLNAQDLAVRKAVR